MGGILEEETAKTLAESREMIKFYRALAAVHSNAVFRVMRAGRAIDMIRQAEEETKILMKVADGNHNCPEGQIWDDVLDKCVKI
ncbi:MAG: hypothetical protein ACR2MG_00190 [Pyrinomonadaceae bacterium]